MYLILQKLQLTPRTDTGVLHFSALQTVSNLPKLSNNLSISSSSANSSSFFFPWTKVTATLNCWET